tara:strand:- start:72 stop:278 length:207 start_codon:yes stop_codon:yes gene_type:complete
MDNKYTYPWAVPIQMYIIDKHSGNITAFAKTQDVRYDQVGRWIKRNCVVIDGTVYCEVSKKKESPNDR